MSMAQVGIEFTSLFRACCTSLPPEGCDLFFETVTGVSPCNSSILSVHACLCDAQSTSIHGFGHCPILFWAQVLLRYSHFRICCCRVSLMKELDIMGCFKPASKETLWNLINPFVY